MALEYRSDGTFCHQTFRELGQLGKADVLVKVTAAALCHRDLIELQREFPGETQEIAFGHEGAGVVQEVGSDVQGLAVGHHVVWAHLPQCARSCCMSRQHGPPQGSFATHVIVHYPFLIRIPRPLSDEDAVSLVCGGSAAFFALKEAKLPPGAPIGVWGMGSLGHLAVQFAAKQGHPVVVYSGDFSKSRDARQLGAATLFTYTDIAAVYSPPAPHRPFPLNQANFVTATSVVASDWHKVAKTVLPGGKVILFPDLYEQIGMPVEDITSLTPGLTLRECLCAPSQIIKEMLAFAAYHHVRARTESETMTMTKENIERALGRLRVGRLRYKAVFIVSPDFVSDFSASGSQVS